MSACFHGIYDVETVELDDCSIEMTSDTTILDDVQTVINNSNIETTDRPSPWQNRTNNSIILDIVVTSQTPPCTWKLEILVNREYCSLNTVIFSSTFWDWFQLVYTSFFIISIVSASILYILIFHTVVKRRRWRRGYATHADPIHVRTKPDEKEDGPDDNTGHNDLKLKPQASYVNDIGNNDHCTDVIADDPNALANTSTTYVGNLAPVDLRVNEEIDTKSRTEFPYLPKVPQFSACSEKKIFLEKWGPDFLANIRTAAMLFVVTVVFIICFVPAWLMNFSIIEFNTFIYYLYFVNNVANPIIYAFLNKDFRKELTLIFHSCNSFCRKY